ncbi:MAG: MiaB/RimO family radical SAM methylthiotransferase [Anaerolineae bacterium]
MAESYYIWNMGCQMNRADARRAAAALESLGFLPAQSVQGADLVVVNSCVVRQSAEDKALGRLHALRSLRRQRPNLRIVLMGCLVGDAEELHARLPFVDLFVRPSDVEGLKAGVAALTADPIPIGRGAVCMPRPPQGHPPLPEGEARVEGLSPHEPCHAPTVRDGLGSRVPVSAEVIAMMGCDRHCTYCIVRLRRGPARSRPADDIVAEAQDLVRSGVREIVLLGQNVDAYGRDREPPLTLAELLRRVHTIPGLLRVRFLTSHPADLADDLIEAVAELPRVCPHWELPVQSGDDAVLRRMGRGHTAGAYVDLVQRIRQRLPQASIATDVIVGYPGETDDQFQHTLDLIAAVRFEAVHVACYSPRPGTPAARLVDDVPQSEKERRRHAVESLQERILTEANAALRGQELEVLVEDRQRGKWQGRTTANKLVFFSHEEDWRGRLARVRISHTGPWSLQGEVCSTAQRG